MTTVTFYTEGSRITGFDASGHSGYAEEGGDIVCAAVTSAVRLTECAVNDVLGLAASVKVRGRGASISRPLPAAPRPGPYTHLRAHWAPGHLGCPVLLL